MLTYIIEHFDTRISNVSSTLLDLFLKWFQSMATETRESNIRTWVSRDHVSGATVGVSAIFGRGFELPAGPRGMGWTSGEITQGVQIQPDTINQKLTIANYCFPIIKATVNYILLCPELPTLPSRPRGRVEGVRINSINNPEINMNLNNTVSPRSK